MPQSKLRLIKRMTEFIHHTEIEGLDHGLRGIYVLYKSDAPKGVRPEIANVVYVGLSRTGIRGRLRSHAKNKQNKWTHASVYEVWDNIHDDEIVELEGLFRHIYRKDTTANSLNEARGFASLKKLDEVPLAKKKAAMSAGAR